MADIKAKPSDGGNKKILMIGLVFIALGILGTVYEVTRERSPEEKKQAAEDAKLQAEIDRANKKKTPGH